MGDNGRIMQCSYIHTLYIMSSHKKSIIFPIDGFRNLYLALYKCDRIPLYGIYIHIFQIYICMLIQYLKFPKTFLKSSPRALAGSSAFQNCSVVSFHTDTNTHTINFMFLHVSFAVKVASLCLLYHMQIFVCLIKSSIISQLNNELLSCVLCCYLVVFFLSVTAIGG